ncbi:septum formation initiator family protein [Streptomyces anulatus]|uniref:FtsB family cell division protein n=1 Tax=Streptomyces anulatus TaxID=1892 RepID=UPI00225B7A0D|nr:septum formation initiator [Streptomyces anulatus]MCX4484047.1 septum formation initiator family protein [Streptomyces anulatus]
MSKPAAPLKGRAARLARLMPSTGPSTAARTPFVLLVVLLLGGGLITLLLLNSALNEGSFRLSELKRDTTELTDEQQALQRDVDSRSQPDALERRARELGMVPGGSPAFLDPDGTVRGDPTEATAPPPSPSPSPTPGPRASAGAAPDPDATATGASGSASPSGSAPATEPDSATAPAAESTPPPTSPGR